LPNKKSVQSSPENHILARVFLGWTAAARSGKVVADLKATPVCGGCIFSLFEEERTMAYVISDECIACGACVDSCPVGAIAEGDPIYVIDAATCTDCAACVDTCPVTAIAEA
jgi:ferredoxin